MKKMKIWAAVILAAIAFPLCATAEAGDLRLGLRIPVGVYGWTPLDDDWADTIAGAAGIRTGAEVFPLGGGRGYSDRGFFLSGRACAGYRLGLGDKNTYNARLHSLTAEFVLLARLNFTRQQGLYLGCGPLWEMVNEILAENRREQAEKMAISLLKIGKLTDKEISVASNLPEERVRELTEHAAEPVLA